MAAALGASSCLVGPIPFKDVVSGGDDHHHIVSPPEEYADIISAMPTTTIGAGYLMRQCQGAWLPHQRVPGLLTFQRRFTPRPGDVLLASPPKCGTTWLKALSFATMARAAYPPGDDGHPLLRLNPHDCVPLVDDLFSAGQEAKLDALPSPRLMNTHLHHSLLPPSIAQNPGCKIVYVCREPKDMLISVWHFVKNFATANGSMYRFSDLFENACEGKHVNGPIWDHILGYWRASKASPERVLFLRYEEMLRNPVGKVRELARFLGVPFSLSEEAAGLPANIVKLCSIETLRGVDKAGASGIFVKFPHASFFRKGVAGDWVNHMTPEMAKRFDGIVEEKLHGEPKDMLISVWHFVKNFATAKGSLYRFSNLFENACEGKHVNGPIWDHILGYWRASKTNPERVLFLRYEEMMRDPVGKVRELAQFLRVPFSLSEEAAGLPADIVKLCSIETLRGVDKAGASGIFVKFPHASFFGKWVAGD